MTSKKTKKAPAVVPAMPRRLKPVELALTYEVMPKITVVGSVNTHIKADVLEWIEDQMPKQAVVN